MKEYKELLKTNKKMKEKKDKKSKYNNKKIEIDGVIFDSLKEGNRFKELILLQRSGEIKDLKIQVPFELVPKQVGERPVTYKADFTYYDNRKQQMIVEDTKGFRTKDYVIKRKLMKHLYPEIEFIES